MSSFTWWYINLGITLCWFAAGLKSGSWFLVLGSVVYLGIAFLVELPKSSGAESWEEREEDESWLE